MSDQKSKRLEELEKRRDELNARIQQVRSRETAKKRKEATRRLVLIGAAISDAWGADSDQLRRLMDGFLARPRDRELFGLLPVSPTGAPCTLTVTFPAGKPADAILEALKSTGNWKWNAAARTWEGVNADAAAVKRVVQPVGGVVEVSESETSDALISELV